MSVTAFHKDNPMLPWRRFWCPLGDSIHCGDDGRGFFTDPEGQSWWKHNEETSPLTDLVPAHGLLVLCGEPGMGKSTDLIGIRAQLEEEANEQSGELIWLEARYNVPDAAGLREYSVRTEEWRRWRERGTSIMTLVLDGVDEGLMRVPNLINDLNGLIRNEPLERLRVILACRTAEWPVEPGKELANLWKEDKSRKLIYELCPLRFADAALAARSHSVDENTFFEAVHEQQVAGLAARPVTLFFLLEEFREGGGEFPGTHRELYTRGTKRLVGEMNKGRAAVLRAAGRTVPQVNDLDRLRAAQRLAAVLLTGGRGAIFDPEAYEENAAPGYLFLEEASGSASPDAVTLEALRAALETPLFSSRGVRRFGFAHQTFAECLAAQHLKDLSLVQLRSLLCGRDGNGEHVIPQLSELAAWVAGWHGEFLDHLLSIDPDVLLRSDVSLLDERIKEQLVGALLKGAEEGRIFEAYEAGRFMNGLRHPGLAEQLRVVISNPLSGHMARRIAFRVAQTCGLAELAEDALAIAHDRRNDSIIRDRAVSLLTEVLPAERLHLLEPLAREKADHDRDNDIRGKVLMKLIPRHWKVREALPFLHAPGTGPTITLYHAFLSHRIPELLEDGDVPALLEYFRARPGWLNPHHDFFNLTAATFARALSLMDDPVVVDAAVRTWRGWCERYENLALQGKNPVSKALNSSDEVRRKFAAAYLNHSQTESENAGDLCNDTPILGKADLDWLLDELVKEETINRPAWASAIYHVALAGWNSGACFDKLLLRIEQSPELNEVLGWLLLPTELENEDVENRRSKFLEEKRKQEEFMRRFQREEPPAPPVLMESALNDLEHGKTERWINFWRAVSLTTENGHQFDGPDISSCAGWRTLSGERQEIARLGARAFLLKHGEQAQTAEPRSHFRLAGAAAVWLWREGLDSDHDLRENVKTFWIESMIYGFDVYETSTRELFAAAYRLAPERTLSGLFELVAENLRRGGYATELRTAALCWNETFDQAAGGFLSNPTSAEAVLRFLDELRLLSPRVVTEYALQVSRENDPARARLFPALVNGLRASFSEVWRVAKPLLENDRCLASKIWLHISYNTSLRDEALFESMSEDDAADCYLMLNHLFPRKKDPVRQTTHVRPRDEVIRVRDRLPHLLAAKGTEAGCQAILKIISIRPDDEDRLRWHYQEALENTRRNLWQPPSVSHILKILTSVKARLVRDADDLLEVVMESLSRLQFYLTGDKHPAVEELWNCQGAGNRRKAFKPKDEEALSDSVARWINRDLGPASGVVVHREVQPRRGQKTDVIVDATVSGRDQGFKSLTVVIEVKGCWHQDVLTGLKSQLVYGYLKPHGWTHGVYLVGWFVCPKWETPVNKLQSRTLAKAVDEVAALAAPFEDGKDKIIIKTVVLDCSLPDKTPSAIPKKGRGKNFLKTDAATLEAGQPAKPVKTPGTTDTPCPPRPRAQSSAS